MTCDTIVDKQTVFELIESKDQTVILEKQDLRDIFLDVQTEIIEDKASDQGKTAEYVSELLEHTHTTPLRVIETIFSTIDKGIPHTLPGDFAYTPDPSGHGRNLWIKVDGQDLTPNGISIVRDYEETDSKQVTFNRTIGAGSNIIYIIFN